MKNNNYKIRFIFTMMLSMGIVTSCKDYLNINPVTSFGPDYVFSDVDNATKAVLGVYNSLTGDPGYGIRLNMYYPYDNDEMMGQGGGGTNADNERRDIAHYAVQPSNTQLPLPFNQLYTGIERANICIYYIPKMSGYSGSAELKKLHGEALTLRAQFYGELIRNWGDVPAQYLPSSFEKELFKKKEDRALIYDKILQDLADASALVPWRSGSSADERISQGAVRGLRARIALAAGGYSLKNKIMTRVTNYKDYYTIARDETNAIIQSNEHHLNPSFQSVFKDAITAHKLEPNGEIIWQIGMGGGSGPAGDSKLGYYNGPVVNGNGNGALTILPNFFYLFEQTDSRRDVTCAPYNVNLNNSFAPRTLATIVDGKFRRDWITNPVPSPTSSQQYFGLAWPLLRYSDVLLMFAEADNEINNGPTAAATTAFQQVRTRAYGANPIGTIPGDYTNFFNAIVNERSLELAGEGIRKYDLLRWNMLGTKLNDTKAMLAAFAGDCGLGYTGLYNIASLPPTTAPISNLPAIMWYKTASSTTSGLGLEWTSNFYSPAPGSPPAASTSVTWRGFPTSVSPCGAQVTPVQTISTTITISFAYGFIPGKHELMPFATSVLDANSSLVQNENY